jgi:type I restriction enzyme M protein
MITGELKSKVDRLWTSFWNNGISNPLSVIEQISYLLFIKRLDDLELVKEKKAQRLGRSVKDAIFPADKQHCRWSHFKNLNDAEAMLAIVRDEAFPFIKELGGTTGTSAYAKHMKDAVFMIPSAALLVSVVQQIDNIPMEDRDTKGDLYEYMLSKLSTAGTNGQFRTPRHIIKLMVDLTAPKPMDLICDPACGTAGFLVAAAEYLRDLKDEDGNSVINAPGHLEHYQSRMFHGFDFDATMLRIGSMNLMLHGIESPKIEARDSLSEDHAGVEEAFTLVLANPPFKGSLEESTIAKDLTQIIKTKKTELLFIALFLRLLKKGGRAAAIVPDGVLFGSSKAHKGMRKSLVEEHKLDGVIAMPSGVFKPYAGVSTAIVLFTKVGVKSGGTDFVWFYDMQADGFSLDDKRQPIDENDIPDILARWRSRDVEEDTDCTSKAFFVPREEIEANGYDLSINSYNTIPKIHKFIRGIKTQYNNYKQYSLRDIVIEINSVTRGNSFKNETNSIYLRRIYSDFQVVASLEDIAVNKQHSYYQLILNEKAINKYIVAFLKSEPGIYVLESFYSLLGSIPRINLIKLKKIPVVLPPIEVQEQIVQTQNKLDNLKEAVGKFEKELSVNPIGSVEITSQLDNILETIGMLTIQDKVRNIIREGESRKTEFKETFSIDIKTNKKEKYIEEMVLKTIVAFLNSDGGTLLVGVEDNGNITGLNEEIRGLYKNNNDRFLLHSKNLIKSRIGESFYPFIDTSLVSIDSKIILLVYCKKSKTPCFLDKVDFYVRTNPATDKLVGLKVHEYIRNNFTQ